MLYLTQGIALGLYGAFLPGPLQAFILSQIIKKGWKRSLYLAFVPFLSDAPVIILFSLLLSQLPAWVTMVLKIVGGCFILYLAWDAYQSSKKTGDISEEKPRDGGLLKGVMMNFLNPNVYIFWGTIGAPILIEGWQKAPILGLAFVFGMEGTMLLSLLLLIFLFGRIGQFNAKIQKYISWGIVLLLLGVGLYMLISGFITLFTAA